LFILVFQINESKYHELAHSKQKINEAISLTAQYKILFQDYYELNNIFTNSLDEFDGPRSGEFVE